MNDNLYNINFLEEDIHDVFIIFESVFTSEGVFSDIFTNFNLNNYLIGS